MRSIENLRELLAIRTEALAGLKRLRDTYPVPPLAQQAAWREQQDALRGVAREAGRALLEELPVLVDALEHAETLAGDLRSECGRLSDTLEHERLARILAEAGCTTCNGTGLHKPHDARALELLGSKFATAADCPEGRTVPIDETGELDFTCGCPANAPCPDCDRGRRLEARRTLRAFAQAVVALLERGAEWLPDDPAKLAATSACTAQHASAIEQDLAELEAEHSSVTAWARDLLEETAADPLEAPPVEPRPVRVIELPGGPEGGAQ